MAEAASNGNVNEHSLFFCHKCKAEIRPVMPDYICPSCNGGFIEELNEDTADHSDDSSYSDSDRRLSLDRDDDSFGAIYFSDFLDHLNGRPARNPFLRGHNTGSRSPSSTSPTLSASGSTTDGVSSSSSSSSSGFSSSNRTPGASDSNRSPFSQMHPGRQTITFHRRGGPGNQPPPPEMISLLQHLMGGLTNPPPLGGPGGIPFPVQMFNIHGSPRDYAWGEGGLDSIITQLLNSAEGQGAPPAPKDAIQRLENIEINNKHIEQSAECPVCKEDFTVGETAKQLPCSHFFHPQCVDTWLEMHNTCPVCRKPIGSEGSSSSAT